MSSLYVERRLIFSVPQVMISIRTFGLAAILSGALAGCAALPGVVVERAEFEIEGRAAVRYGDEGGSTRIRWRHGANEDDLLITGPLGQGIARIVRRDGEYLLTTAEGQSHRAADAESLTEAVLGWRLPLRGLPDWVRGRASASRPASVEAASDSRPRVILQDDWRIEYLTWGDALPQRLLLRHEAGGRRVEIRLVIDQWNPPI